MSTLVTGSAGFIGSHLAERLLDAEGFDIRTGQDGLDFELVNQAVRGKELVFHLANIPAHRLSIDNPYEITKNNFLATLNFAEACRMHDVKMVFASSFSVYGKQKPPFKEDMPMQPDTPYGVTKQACEELLKMYHETYGMDVIIVRPSNIWGSRDYLHEPMQVLPTWVNNAKRGKPLTVFGENTTRDFTHIDDFIAGILLASKRNGWDVFNIAAGKEIRLVDVAMTISDNIIVKPLPRHEAERWYGDNTHARTVLDWEPKTAFWDAFREYCRQRLGRDIKHQHL
ncbi:MAG: NAD-dependent epimerase/dehydratase family protein [Candidatus Aenigmarchaeota archaeon]|nr:NAD-dependent epimerase/dehydratase family protein [Candidatus Aenigmarchaeota archaeon]